MLSISLTCPSNSASTGNLPSPSKSDDVLGWGAVCWNFGRISLYCAVLSYAPQGEGVIHAHMPAELPPNECHNYKQSPLFPYILKEEILSD